MYGEKGFTDNKELIDLLAPHLPVYPWTVGDKPNRNYWRIDKVPAEKLLKLCELVPESTMEDAQNSGPTFRNLVDIARKHPTSLFGGYVVGSHRQDERVSLDALYLSIRDTNCDVVISNELDAGWPDEDDLEEIGFKTYRRLWWD